MEIHFDNREIVETPSKLAEILRQILAAEDVIDQEKEHLWTIGLTPSHIIKYIDLVSLGTLTNSVVHPRETYRMAILKGVESIIIAHNHTSDNDHPSNEDVKTTGRLAKAGEIIGIKLLDHIIVTPTKFYSFHNDGKI